MKEKMIKTNITKTKKPKTIKEVYMVVKAEVVIKH